MSICVTPYIYLAVDDRPHDTLLEVLDTAVFTDAEAAQRAMDGLRADVAASVFGGVLTVEFDID